MDNHIIDERPLRIEQRRILRLPDRQPRRVIHRNVLHGGHRFGPGQSDIAHVADVKNADAGAHRHVLGDNAAPDRRWVFHRHVPAVKLHHLRAHLAMDGVQRGLAHVFWDDGRSGLDNGQEKPRLDSGWAAGTGTD